MKLNMLALSLSLALLQTAALAGPLAASIDRGQQALALGVDAIDAQNAELPLPSSVTLQRDISYGDNPAQRFDVYLPSVRSEKTAAPVIFMVHGGGWRHGDKAASGVVDNKVARWVTQGVVFVSINYRLLPEADPLIQAQDVALALAKAQSLAASWGADRSRFVLMGHSAGAHLVSLLTADPSIARQQGALPWLGTVALDSAAFNVVQIMEAPHFPLYDDAFGTDPAYWRTASPYYRLTARTSPLLAVCSTPRLESCPQARDYAAKANLLGGRTDPLGVDMTHGEINANLGLPGVYTERVERFLRGLGLAL